MAHSTAIETSKKKTRSRITNGRSLLPKEVDGRSLYVRRLRDLVGLISDDLGGADQLSQAEAAIVRRAATLIIALERLEASFATDRNPSPADLDLYQRLGNSMRRMLREVGLKRRPRDITQPTDLQAYLRSKRGTRAQTINGSARRIHAADDADG